MNNLQKNDTQKAATFSDAVNEGAIKPYELYEELIPLLRDYFVGEFDIAKDGILLSFLNGQKFRLCIQQVLS